MSEFDSVGPSQCCFSLNYAALMAFDPSPNLHRVSRGDLLPEADAYFRSQCLKTAGRYNLGHGFIQNRADNTAMDDSPKTFEIAFGHPVRDHRAAIVPAKIKMQSPTVVLAAGKTG